MEKERTAAERERTAMEKERCELKLEAERAKFRAERAEWEKEMLTEAKRAKASEGAQASSPKPFASVLRNTGQGALKRAAPRIFFLVMYEANGALLTDHFSNDVKRCDSIKGGVGWISLIRLEETKKKRITMIAKELKALCLAGLIAKDTVWMEDTNNEQVHELVIEDIDGNAEPAATIKRYMAKKAHGSATFPLSPICLGRQ